MSNTAVVTPFALAAGACALAASAATWLCEETETDRQADAAHAAARLQGAHRGLRACLVRPPDLGAFLSTAQHSGYRVEAHSEGYRLIGASGRRLLARVDSAGSLELVSRHVDDTQALVRFHVTERLTDALRTRHFSPEVKRRQDGEVRIVTQRKDQPTVDVVVQRDGRARIDVDCMAGSACETLMRDLAADAGLSVVDMNIKPEYFARPGEPRQVVKR